MQAARSAVLVDVLYPKDWAQTRVARILKDVVLMVGFAGLVALCAQIAVRLPWTTVPITGQTFAVLVTGGALGMWRGAGSLTIYMLMGMVGIPVYAPRLGLTGSWDVHFIAPWRGTHALPWDLSSGGYIVGFIFAAALVGFFAERQWDRKPWMNLGMFLGNVVLYIPGILWLAYLIGTEWIYPYPVGDPPVYKPLADLIAGSDVWDKALKGGLYPFIVGDLTKLFLATLTLPTIWALVQRFRKG